MTLIEELCGKLADELQDAKSYAQMALDHRADNQELAQLLHGISLEEMGHFGKLYAEAMKMADGVKEMQRAFEEK